MTFAVLALLLLISSTPAETTPSRSVACDSKPLKKAIAEATPHGAAQAFLDLAACDPAAAGEAAPTVFPNMLPSAKSHDAVITALGLGQASVVRDWVSNLMPDERSGLFTWFGKSCADQPAILPFIIESSTALGDRFWNDRWHRALRSCHEPVAFDFVKGALQSEIVNREAVRFASVLGVFTYNWRGQTIPSLKDLAVTRTGQNQASVLEAFPDAAGIGSVAGPDPAAIPLAVQAVVDVAPQIPVPLVEKARDVLLILGDSLAAGDLAAVRYADRIQPTGGLLWGAIAVERITCKNGKLRLGVHSGPIHEAGHMWPEQVRSPTEEAIRATWDLSLAEKCKGTMVLEIQLPPEPFLTEADYITWKDAQVLEWRRHDVDRIDVIEEASLDLN